MNIEVPLFRRRDELHLQKLTLGHASIAIINLGELSFKLKDVENVPEKEWQPRYSDLFEKPTLFPSQSVFVSVGEVKLLVDAGDYDLFASLDRSYVPEGYKRPPDLLNQLSELNISTNDVTDVVITHAHYDHYAGVTRRRTDGGYFPSFARARYFLGRSDWEDKRLQEDLGDPNSPNATTLGVLQEQGLLELLEGSRTLSQEIEITPSPGESPGHQIVRIQSRGETLYCVGDLFHHQVEIENPTWMAQWDDPTTNLNSRRNLMKSALDQDALILASHMALGKLAKSVEDEKIKFIPV